MARESRIATLTGHPKALSLGLLALIWIGWAASHFLNGKVTSVPKVPMRLQLTMTTIQDGTETTEAPLSTPAPPSWQQQHDDTSDRPLILYAYAESESARENLRFFLDKGVHGAADFVFIFNGETTAVETIPKAENIRVVQRPNTCFDLGAFGEVLRADGLWTKYKRFITLNASIRGPFLPIWSSDCWSDLFLNRVTDVVKLVGISLNCRPRPHVQSMILATDQAGMYTLLDPDLSLASSTDDRFGTRNASVGLSGCYEDWSAAVHAEIGTTGLILDAGYQVDALMASLHSETTMEEYCSVHPESGDMWWNDRYYGGNIHPYETIFLKANRNVDKKLMKSMTEWHLSMNRTSFDTCGGG